MDSVSVWAGYTTGGDLAIPLWFGAELLAWDYYPLHTWVIMAGREITNQAFSASMQSTYAQNKQSLRLF